MVCVEGQQQHSQSSRALAPGQAVTMKSLWRRHCFRLGPRRPAVDATRHGLAAIDVRSGNRPATTAQYLRQYQPKRGIGGHAVVGDYKTTWWWRTGQGSPNGLATLTFLLPFDQGRGRGHAAARLRWLYS
jgi:hypothetical protein